ncbi:hypothetical protein WN943_023537 [Citrus x changshan-huyou]
MKQHKLSSPAKAKALRRPLRINEKQAFRIIIRNLNTSSYIVILTPGITNPKSLRHPRKDKSSISSQARRRRKLLGGHCECF